MPDERGTRTGTKVLLYPMVVHLRVGFEVEL